MATNPVFEMTDAELNTMMEAADLAEMLNDPKWPAIESYFMGMLSDQYIKTYEYVYEDLRSKLTANAPKSALDAARKVAEREADKWTKEWVTSELNKMGDVIAKGIERGDGPAAIARNLDMVQKLDKNRAASYLKFIDKLDEIDPPLSAKDYERRLEREYQKLLRDRRQTIAQDQERKATGEANYLEAQATGRKYKMWMTSGDGRVSDVCYANEAQGPIDIDKNFDGSGTNTVPGHPNCRCTVSYIKSDEQRDRAAKRAEARAASTAAARKAYAEGERQPGEE